MDMAPPVAAEDTAVLVSEMQSESVLDHRPDEIASRVPDASEIGAQREDVAITVPGTGEITVTSLCQMLTIPSKNKSTIITHQKRPRGRGGNCPRIGIYQWRRSGEEATPIRRSMRSQRHRMGSRQPDHMSR